MPRFFDRIHRIPLIQDFYPNVPALPFEITDILRTIPLLAIRSAETIPAKNGTRHSGRGSRPHRIRGRGTCRGFRR